MSTPMLPLLSTPAEAAAWLRAHGSRLQTDSRRLEAGDLFVAWPGAAHDARVHVLAALEHGAAASLVEADGMDAFDFARPAAADVAAGRVAAYAGLKSATGPIAAAFYDTPSRRLDVVAVTGTNGKTTSAWWLAQALSHGARGCGLVGTLGAVLNGRAWPITAVSGASYTIAVNSTGLTGGGGGSAYRYPQPTDALTWVGEFDVPVRFASDRFSYAPSGRDIWQFTGLGLIELRK